jgi:Fe-S-cluster containining protein
LKKRKGLLKNPLSLQKNKSTSSQSCIQCGICCRLFLINLNQKELLSGKFETQFKEYISDTNFDTIKKYGGNILKRNSDGSCNYLENNLCSIHKNRPQACRNFSCSSKLTKYKGMIALINKEKEVF